MLIVCYKRIETPRRLLYIINGIKIKIDNKMLFSLDFEAILFFAEFKV